MPSEIKTDLASGLTGEQVQKRVQAGQVNTQRKRASRSAARIVFDNVFTFFNLMNAVLGALILWVGSYKNGLFMLVVFFNTVIGIIQELRAKRTLDRLSLISAAKVTVIRDGRMSDPGIEELVLDDVMILSAGRQIVADAVVRDGEIEVNESLVTGEADAILKKSGDGLLSGSYVVSGEARAQVVRVGLDSYANQITAEAKAYKRHPSELRRAMNAILKVISIIIIPLGIGLFLRQYHGLKLPMDDAVISTVAAVLGMIPEGLVLLTSIALAAGVITLGKRNTLVRELFCIETLARVDVLCLDKTGTLTEGRMMVNQVIPLKDMPVDELMGNLVRVLPDGNETFLALKRHFEVRDTLTARRTWPFSSERKVSGAYFEGRGACMIGAYEFMISPERREMEIQARIERCAKEGSRVLALAVGKAEDKGDAPPADLEIAALILLSDAVRPEAAQTLEYFREQGVRLVILSGDHPATVAQVAKKAGLPGADRYIDASGLKDEMSISAAIQNYNVFGRVLPAQKKQIISALKTAGHTVAMVGDGANDVPALKEADCSVAMAQGADAAKQCANLVLLNSNFAAMPYIVREGRRVVNNIQSAATLFLIKTLFSAILTIVMLCFSSPYPFMPIHLTLISACAVGIPTFIFAMEPNDRQIGANFFRSVLAGALTGALTVVLWVCVNTALTARLSLSPDARSTMCLITTGVTSLLMIPRVYPLNTALRKAVFGAMLALFFGALLFFRNLLALESLERLPAILTAVMACLTPFILHALHPAIEKLAGGMAHEAFPL